MPKKTNPNRDEEMFYMIPAMDWENITVTMRPDLPKATWKSGKITYTMTDLRYLRQDAVSTLFAIIMEAANDPDLDSIEFEVPDNADEDDVNALCDIVTGVKYTAKGRKYHMDGGFLCNGVIHKRSEECHSLEFLLTKDHVKAIYEFARKAEDNLLSMTKLIEFIVERGRTMFDEFWKTQKAKKEVQHG